MLWDRERGVAMEVAGGGGKRAERETAVLINSQLTLSSRINSSYLYSPQPGPLCTCCLPIPEKKRPQ